jgi:hypothetical protein
VEELEAVSRLCPQLVELRGVSVGVLDERYRGEKHLQVRRPCFCTASGRIAWKKKVKFVNFLFYRDRFGE